MVGEYVSCVDVKIQVVTKNRIQTFGRIHINYTELLECFFYKKNKGLKMLAALYTGTGRLFSKLVLCRV